MSGNRKTVKKAKSKQASGRKNGKRAGRSVRTRTQTTSHCNCDIVAAEMRRHEAIRNSAREYAIMVAERCRAIKKYDGDYVPMNDLTKMQVTIAAEIWEATKANNKRYVPTDDPTEMHTRVILERCKIATGKEVNAVPLFDFAEMQGNIVREIYELSTDYEEYKKLKHNQAMTELSQQKTVQQRPKRQVKKKNENKE